MKLYEISLSEEDLGLSDTELGKKARQRLLEAVAESKARLEAGRTKNRKRLGVPITIDGVTYDSRTQAMKALGMTPPAFVKKYGYAT